MKRDAGGCYIECSDCESPFPRGHFGVRLYGNSAYAVRTDAIRLGWVVTWWPMVLCPSCKAVRIPDEAGR